MIKIILFIGAPGSGKGSIGTICEKHGYIHISSSQLLRDAGYDLDNPKYIPNEVTMELIKDVISQATQNATIILDGFPRTMEQVEMIENYFTINHAIYFKIPKREALNRVLNRIVCSHCKEIYSTTLYNPPKIEGICNKCGSILKRRLSDSKNVFEKRYINFIRLTYPIIRYYSNQGKLITVDALHPNEAILTVIKQLSKNN